ncbi:MAG: carboxy terminal-processing peptidase [Planctomycetota bacterium]
MKSVPAISTRWVHPTVTSIFACTFTLLIFTLSASSFGQEKFKANQYEKTASQMVAILMQEHHLSSRALDDTISTRAFKKFIEGLDPLKAYFMQSDINSFNRFKSTFDDQLKRGDFSTAFAIFEKFLQRVDQKTELAIKMVDVDHDYSVDEELVTDTDLMQYASTDQESEELWRKRIKYSLLVAKGDKAEKETKNSDGEPKKKAVDPNEMLRKRYSSFARRMHQMDSEEVVERYISAVTHSFDPHTTYMSAGSFENFLIQMSLELEGIGATLQGSDEGYTVIKSIVPGGAAATQGGLKVEDKIVAVGQGEDDGSKTDRELFQKHGSELVDVTGMKLDDVVGMIRGKAGTMVRLNVLSEADSELHVVKIVREKIQLEDSAAHGQIFEEGTKPDGTPNKIGVIELPSFYSSMEAKGNDKGRSSTTDVLKILNEFNDKDVDALILDLRANGGGSLKEAIDCTGLFIDLGPVVQVKDPYGEIDELNDENSGMAWEKPLVVLISKFSASASEILAGAVQDYNRGLVVGDTASHGKGTVQSMMNISQMVYRVRNPPNHMGALKITTQQFYRPNGDSTQKRGVLSDIILPSITDKMDVSESDLDFPVEFDRVPKANYSSYGFTSPDFIQKLGKLSQDRLAKSEKFKTEIGKIEKYVEQKNLKAVSLNEEKFMARRRELNAEKEDEKTFEDQMLPSKEIKRNYYLDEVIQITIDYVKMLGQNG